MLLFALMAWLHCAVDCNAEEMYTLPSLWLTPSHKRASKQEKNRIENGNLPTTRNSPVVLDAVYLNVFPVRTYFSHTRCCSRDQAKYNFISFVIGIVIFTRPPAYFLLTHLANAHAYNHIHPNNCTHTGTHKMVPIRFVLFCVCSTRLHIFVRNM